MNESYVIKNKEIKKYNIKQLIDKIIAHYQKKIN